MRLCYQLPYPPTINTYWRRRGARYFICAKGIEFREAVKTVAPDVPVSGKVYVDIELTPPDRRIRDADNCVKCVFDGLQHGGVLANDSQIREYHVKMNDEPVEDGLCVVSIRPL